MVPGNPLDNPLLLNSMTIFSSTPEEDYEQLVNRVERHSKCSKDYCLRKKGNIPVCCYGAPWEIKDESSLRINDKCQKEYLPIRNDDKINIHNAKNVNNVGFMFIFFARSLTPSSTSSMRDVPAPALEGDHRGVAR